MSITLNRGKELITINAKNNSQLMYSTNSGRTWLTRYSGNSTVGKFLDLTDNGKEILANTEKGFFYSTNEGRTWLKRS